MSEPKVSHTLWNDGEEEVIEFPAKFEVCYRCRGTGKHVNPSIDGHGLSREDFDADPDFEEDYFAGVYDVICEDCNGLRVVPEIDHSRLTPELKHKLLLLDVQWCEEAADRREQEMERRMGA